MGNAYGRQRSWTIGSLIIAGLLLSQLGLAPAFGQASGVGEGAMDQKKAPPKIEQKAQTYLPWTVGTAQPVRFAPALAVHINVRGATPDAGQVAQRDYEKWKAAGAWNWVNTQRRHWLMLYTPLYNWQDFYTDENVRPADPSNPDDPGYSWRTLDEMLAIDAVQKDGAKWLVRINWQSWGKGTPQWLMKGQGAVAGEDNGLGGGMLFPGSENEGLPAFQRPYVQKEFRYFAEAFGKRYKDRSELGGIIFDEIQLKDNALVRPPDLEDEAYFRTHDNAMLDFARAMPNTAICVYQVFGNSRKEQLAPGVNIGFGCADARLWVPMHSKNGPWRPDDPPADTGNSYYGSAQVYNYAAKNPVGGSRHFWVAASEDNGWIQRGPIPEVCGGENNILGFPAGTMKTPGEIEPDYFMQYHAAVPRKPGAVPGLNNVPGIVHASWLIAVDHVPSRRQGTDLPRSKDKWAEAFAKLGPQGIDCMLEEPYGWDDHIGSLGKSQP
jgi:hypothetical protein